MRITSVHAEKLKNKGMMNMYAMLYDGCKLNIPGYGKSKNLK